MIRSMPMALRHCALALIASVVPSCVSDHPVEDGDTELPSTGVVSFDDNRGHRLHIELVDGAVVGFAFSAPIGEPLDEGDGSVAGLYQRMFPDATIPSNLVRMSDHIEATLRSVRVQAVTDSLDTRGFAGSLESQSTFNSTVCKTFTRTSGSCTYTYTPSQCRWQNTTNRAFTTGAAGQGTAGDRSYYWNQSGVDAGHQFFPVSGPGETAPVWTGTGTWGQRTAVASQIGFPPPYIGQIGFPLAAKDKGELGVTWHRVTSSGCTVPDPH
jgi:hypothetical protein